ncbi:MAG: electron transport complex subunit RsxC, partial [Ruminococcus sp.]|nr:electron transport complex subunit RsxC [Ruminococcus sp.]
MKLHGIHVPHRKNTASLPPVRPEPPKTVTIPMSMHIGRPAKVLVKRGDEVRVGTKIGEADGYISSPVHASVSGKVQKIDEITIMNGSKVAAVVIESDGLQTPDESIQPPEVHDLDTFIDAVKNSGSVGLGGAGFPTFVKFVTKDLSVFQEVVINAAECEPYITSDTRTMLDRGESVFKGVEALKKYLGIKKFIIGIENNKPEAIANMKRLASQTDGVTVHVLPAMYPQ